MPYKVEKRGFKWVVVKDAPGSTAVMGKFDTEEEAKKQQAALYANEKKSGGGGKPSAPPFGKN